MWFILTTLSPHATRASLLHPLPSFALSLPNTLRMNITTLTSSHLNGTNDGELRTSYKSKSLFNSPNFPKCFALLNHNLCSLNACTSALFPSMHKTYQGWSPWWESCMIFPGGKKKVKIYLASVKQPFTQDDFFKGFMKQVLLFYKAACEHCAMCWQTQWVFSETFHQVRHIVAPLRGYHPDVNGSMPHRRLVGKS